MRQHKFKKFNILKYKPHIVPSHTNSQEDDVTQDRLRKKVLYLDIIKNKSSESTIDKKSNELPVSTKPINTIQQLRMLNTKKRGKSPIRSKSNTQQNKDEQLRAQTEQLKGNESTKKYSKTETTKNTNRFTSTETPKQNQKNRQMASNS